MRLIVLFLFSLHLAASPYAPNWRPIQPGPDSRGSLSNPYVQPPLPYSQNYYSYYWSVPKQQELPPKIETWLSERRPLVQQNLIYRIRVHNTGNIQEISPELPQSEKLIFKPLGEPAHYRISDQPYDWLSEFFYLVVPLQSGSIHLPPLRIVGKYKDGRSFNISADHGLSLYVQPIPLGKQPWLPLYDLKIESEIKNPQRLRSGEPFAMQIKLKAIGATGQQLPDIDPQWPHDFKVYPGQVESHGQISQDGLDLIGEKIFHFTLIPHYGGQVDLVSVRIPWWDLKIGRPAEAVLTPQSVYIAGPPSPEALQKGADLPGSQHWYFWLPLLFGFMIMLFGWFKVLFGAGWSPFLRRFKPLLGDFYQPIARFFSYISPRRYFHRMRRSIASHLPISWKLWYCLRAVDKENDPETWSHALQILAAKHLGVKKNMNLHDLGQSIVSCHPAADAEQIAKLMAELDQAIYGGQPLDSFADWKARFKKQIKPRLFPVRFKRCQIKPNQHELPELNPIIR